MFFDGMVDVLTCLLTYTNSESPLHIKKKKKTKEA